MRVFWAAVDLDLSDGSSYDGGVCGGGFGDSSNISMESLIY